MAKIEEWICLYTCLAICAISLGLIIWDVSLVRDTLEKNDFDSYHLWIFGMSLTVTIVWFFLLILIYKCCKGKSKRGICTLILICCGPNLLLWNILGCVVELFENQEYFTNLVSNDSKVFMSYFNWIILYIFSIACTCVLFILLIVKACEDFRLKSLKKRQQQIKSEMELLIRGICFICLDHFVKSENIRELYCGHC